MRSLVLIAALALLSPSLASAQEGIVPSCDTAGSGSGYDCQLADIVVLAQNILTFIIVFAVILAGLLFAYAGLLLATDRGNEQNRRKATSIFWSAIIGLIVVLTAWLIVNTLLSLLTRGDLKFWTDNIRRATVPPPQEVVPPWEIGGWDGPSGGEAEGGGGPSVGVGGVAHGVEGCPDCIPITAISCGGRPNCFIDPEYHERLSAIGMAGMEITEGWPPSRTHSNPCHAGGVCVDIIFADRDFSTDRIQAFQTAAQAAGLYAMYETAGTCPVTQCQSFPLCSTGARPCVTGSHFSLYMQE